MRIVPERLTEDGRPSLQAGSIFDRWPRFEDVLEKGSSVAVQDARLPLLLPSNMDTLPTALWHLQAVGVDEAAESSGFVNWILSILGLPDCIGYPI